MMLGHEKSRSAIVAVKPTNKAERSAAEPVEPRAEVEGNAGQQSTHRAQYRVRDCGGREATRVPTAQLIMRSSSPTCSANTKLVGTAMIRELYFGGTDRCRARVRSGATQENPTRATKHITQ